MVCNDVFYINLGGPVHEYAPLYNLTHFHLKGFLHLLKKKGRDT